MALANVAEILASRGLQVVACDWDLEAPGLERYFGADKEESLRLKARPGVVDLLAGYKTAISNSDTIESPGADDEHEVLSGLRIRRPSSYALPVPGSSVRLLTAGRRDGEFETRYNRAVQSFDWDEFYREWAGASYIEFLRRDLNKAGEIVLVDSRTGVTEQGGVCTHHLADLVVVFSAPNDLNLDGAQWMVKTLSRPGLEALRGNRRLGVLVLPARVEVINEEGYLAGFQKKFAEAFESFVPAGVGDRVEFLRRAQIPYIPGYAFSERVAAREDTHRRNLLLYDAYNLVANAILLRAGELDLLAPEKTGAAKAAAATDQPLFLAAASAQPGALSEVAARFTSAGIPVTAGNLDARAIYGGQELPALLKRAAGAGVVMGAPCWLDAEVRQILTFRAANPRFHVFLIHPPGIPQIDVPEPLRRFPVLRLPGSGEEAAALRSTYLEFVERSRGSVAAAAAASASLPGLEPFQEQQAALFWGRDREVEDLARSSHGTPITVLTGDTGCGKTSLLRAGLIPALHLRRFEEAGDAQPPWRILYQTKPDFDQARAFWEQPGATESRSLVIFDHCEGPASLLVHLRQYLQPVDGSRRAIVVPRLFLPQTSVTDSDALCSLARVPGDGLGKVMLAQLAAAGVEMEQGLAERILADLGEECSPAFLQLVLSELWRRRRMNLLTHQAYWEVDAFAGLLKSHAESIWTSLPPNEQDLSRVIFSRIFLPGEGREDEPLAAPVSSILRRTAGPEDMARLLAKLVEQRLLAVREASEGPVVEFAHPKLLIEWPRLREWIDQNRSDLRMGAYLEHAAKRWIESGRNSNLLVKSDVALAQARQYERKRGVELLAEEREFLRASRRRTRRATLLSVLILVLAAGGLILFSMLTKEPSLFSEPVDEEFRLTEDLKPDSRRWLYPEGSWKIVRGEGYEPSDGALEVSPGRGLGVLQVWPKALYDFTATFKIRMSGDSEAAWAFRVQKDGRRYYLFTLAARKNEILLKGDLVQDGKRTPLAQGEQSFPAYGCCQAGDGFQVDAQVALFEFQFRISADPGSSDALPYHGQAFEFQPMRDPEQKLRWGSLSFLAPAKGTLLVEWFRLLYPRRVDRK